MTAFEVIATDGAARAGRLTTGHGPVDTPVFMPVGTRATVRSLAPDDLHAAGAQIVLGNTYHLLLRPGHETIRELGGLHRFMAWDGAILTDSGGFQVWSLAKLRKVAEAGVEFRSPVDGSTHFLSPELAIEAQHALGADIIHPLDECLAYPATREAAERSLDLTLRWAARSKAVHAARGGGRQALFGIVQGGTDLRLRETCAQALAALDFPGYALGGFSVGETASQMAEALPACAAMLPVDRPRYLMGVGRPRDILQAVAAGIDMFDCVLPTRNGRNASAFTMDGPLRLRNATHKRDQDPIESGCSCYTCRHFSRAYLHHLFLAGEMLGPTLLSLHNVAFYCRLMAEIRLAISERRFAEYRAVRLARWDAAA